MNLKNQKIENHSGEITTDIIPFYEMDSATQAEEDIIHIKCVMIGDGAAGKSYAMTRYCRDIVLSLIHI